MSKQVLGLRHFEVLTQPLHPSKNPAAGTYQWYNHGDRIVVTVHWDSVAEIKCYNPEAFTRKPDGKWKNSNGETRYDGKTVVFARPNRALNVCQIWCEGYTNTKKPCYTVDLYLPFNPDDLFHGIKHRKTTKNKTNGCRNVYLDLYILKERMDRGGSKEFRGDGFTIASETHFGRKVIGVKDFKRIK